MRLVRQLRSAWILGFLPDSLPPLAEPPAVDLAGGRTRRETLFDDDGMTVTKGRFHELRRMSATHIGAHRTRQWN